MWEQSGQHEEVALYVRALMAAEHPKASVASRTLVRQLQEALGLSQPGLARLRWRIGQASSDAQREAATGTEGPSARERFKMLEGGRT